MDCRSLKSPGKIPAIAINIPLKNIPIKGILLEFSDLILLCRPMENIDIRIPGIINPNIFQIHLLVLISFIFPKPNDWCKHEPQTSNGNGEFIHSKHNANPFGSAGTMPISGRKSELIICSKFPPIIICYLAPGPRFQCARNDDRRVGKDGWKARFFWLKTFPLQILVGNSAM